MPKSNQTKKQNRYFLHQAKEWQAGQHLLALKSTLGAGEPIEPMLPRYNTKATLFLGCMMLLATATSAIPTNRAPSSKRNRDPKLSPTYSNHPALTAPLVVRNTTTLLAPKINEIDTLTIFHSSSHFFLQLICNRCDQGNYAEVTMSIQPEFRPHKKEKNKNTNTVVNELFDSENNKLSFLKRPLTEKNAINAFAKIRSLHDGLSNRSIQYDLQNFNCIDYVQTVYKAAGGKGFFTDEFGSENLFGIAGAVAYYKHHDFSFSTALKIISIFMQEPANQLNANDFKESPIEQCLIYDVRRTKPYYRSGHTFFAPELAMCKTTPTGEQVLANYNSPLIADCTMFAGKCRYSDGNHVPRSTYPILEKLEPLIRTLDILIS